MQEGDYRILDESEFETKRNNNDDAAIEGPVEQKATLSASIFNLSNTTLGAGIVSIPYFFSNSGYVFGSVLLLIVAFLGAAASILLVRAARESGCWSYMDIAERAYGTNGLVAVWATILSLTIGVMSAFFVQLGATGAETLDSLLSSELKGSWWTEPTFIKTVFIFTILIPLGLQRDLASLSKASLLVLVFLIYLVVMVCCLGESVVGDDDDSDTVTEGDDTDDRFQAAFVGSDFFTAFPIVVLAFGNQLNVQQVVIEMENPTNARVNQVIVGTQVVVSALYLLIGLMGYWQFTGATQDNIMANYHGLGGQSLLLFTVARAGIVFVVLFSYPMLLFPGRACLHSMLETLLLKKDDGRATSNDAGDTQSSSRLSTFLWRHAFVLETMFLIGLTFVVSVAVPVLGVLMGYTGAISGTIQAFIFPAVFHLKLVEKSKVAARGLLLIGIVFGVVSLVVEIYESITG